MAQMKPSCLSNFYLMTLDITMLVAAAIAFVIVLAVPSFVMFDVRGGPAVVVMVTVTVSTTTQGRENRRGHGPLKGPLGPLASLCEVAHGKSFRR
jgi:hypothetical protein